MKVLSILFLAISLFSDINAQIKIYDGRSESVQTKISDQEKQLVENFVRKNEKAIKRFGTSKDFECEKDSIRVDSVADGFFTRKKLVQKAYLYQLCFSGNAQYATSLGGIVIVENNQPAGHYVFANISGYNNLKSLPDLNRNGYSEIALEFSHKINGLQFTKSIKIFDLAPSGLMEMATLETFSRLGETDVAYQIYGKKGVTPIFSQEIYESEPQANKWVLQKKRKEFGTNPPIYSSNNLDILPIYEFSAPTLTASEISQRVLKLIKSVQTVKDISPQNIEKITGLNMQFDPDDRDTYGTSGKVADSTWFYSLSSLSNLNGGKPNRLQFAFRNMEREDDNLSPICASGFETFKKELESVGFSARQKFGEHSRHLGWYFEKQGVSLDVIDSWESKKLERKCIESLMIQTE